jgi:RNA polymerase sigma factor (sigma-70 family)
VTVKEYKVEIKVKNNVLLMIMDHFGIANGIELASRCGISIRSAYHMINLTESAFTSNGVIRSYVNRVADFFNTTPESLYPIENFLNPLEKNHASIEVSFSEIVSISKGLNYIDNENIMRALDTLTPRERRAIAGHYGLDGQDKKTLEGVGNDLGCSPERVRQIIAKGMRKLRNPNCESRQRLRDTFNKL